MRKKEKKKEWNKKERRKRGKEQDKKEKKYQKRQYKKRKTEILKNQKIAQFLIGHEMFQSNQVSRVVGLPVMVSGQVEIGQCNFKNIGQIIKFGMVGEGQKQ